MTGTTKDKGKEKEKEKKNPRKGEDTISYKQAIEVLQMIILFSKLRSKVLCLGMFPFLSFP